MRLLMCASLLFLLSGAVSPAESQQVKPDLLTGGPAVADESSDAKKQKADEHPIDREISELIRTNPSTFGQRDAFSRGIELWDAELNRQYKILSAMLDDSGRQKLRDAQRAWLAFRDAEFRRTDSLYSGKDGSMFIPMSVAARLELIKARALELADSIEILDM